MILLSKNIQKETKKIHCPICGGRLCDTNKSEKILLVNSQQENSGIIIKCYKCGTKIKISINN